MRSAGWGGSNTLRYQTFSLSLVCTYPQHLKQITNSSNDFHKRKMKKKKIMIYCQHLAGMGHLVRCREVIRRLVETFDVCFVSGGQIVPQFQMPPQVEIAQLPGLWQQGTELLPLDTDMSIEETRAQRKLLLLDTFEHFQPDCLITECFPFSKLSMKYELQPLMETAKASTRPVRIICSLRDLIMTQPLSLEAKEKRATKICQLINRFYDAVLFHSDGNFQRLEDCFPQVENLNCDIVYTGYVAQSAAEPVASSAEILDIDESKPAIVVSAGGGRHGYPLLNAVIAASEPIAERCPHHIYMFAGPFMPEADFLKLQQAAAKHPNLTLRRYTALFLEYLRKADLSISLGGYSTTMNL